MNCPTGKQAFSAQQAHEKARNASRRYSTGFSAYQCDLCGGWHVGTTNGMHKQRRIPTRRTNHTPHLEHKMPENFTPLDVFARHTSKDGNAYVSRHRVWNAGRFFAARAAEANKEGGKASCEQITEEQYNKERA